MVLGWIKATTVNQYHLMLPKCNTSYEGWSHLEKILSLVSSTQVSIIKEQLRTLKKEGTEVMQDYSLSIGESLTEIILVDYIFGGLGLDYRYVFTIVRCGTSISFDELTNLLLGEEQMLKRINNETKMALVAYKGNYGRGRPF